MSGTPQWGSGSTGGYGHGSGGSPADGWGTGDPAQGHGASGFGGGWDSGFGDSGFGDSGFGDSGFGGQAPARPFQVPRPASVVPLLAAIAVGVLGAAMSWLSSPTSVIAPVTGWLLCAVGDVLLVAAFQMRDLRAAAESMAYRPSAASGPLRVLALAVAAVGIVLNSMAIAHWVATR